MIQFNVFGVAALGTQLAHSQTLALACGAGMPFTVEAKESIRTVLEFSAKLTADLGLASSATLAKRIIEEMDSSTLATEEMHRLGSRIISLQERIRDDAASVHLLYIEPRLFPYYANEKPLFGNEVADGFPSAIVEIEEAGKCLALERSTASVFHLMRVMEVALKALAKSLEIPYAPSWESYLLQIGKIVGTKWADRPEAQKHDHAFYSEAHAHLSSIKIAWRNPTMHVVKNYTPEQAEEIFGAVRSFMRHLATKLKE